MEGLLCSVDPVFVPRPTIINLNGKLQYKYKSIEVREIPGKGIGVVATDRLEEGFTFPYYGGIQITAHEAVNILKSVGRNDRSKYLAVEEEDEATKQAINWRNADPVLYNSSINNAWIGAYCNEPSPTEFYNAGLVYFPSPPNHQYPDCNDSHVFIIWLQNQLEREKKF
jgi:hypothetical protein